MDHRLPMPAIWVLNLKRSVERRAYITTHLEGLGLNYELVEAIDGEMLSPEEVSTAYLPGEAFKFHERELTRGEIGCALSHLGLYRRQLELGLDEVVILEDDAIVDPAFFEVMDRRGAFPSDWEMVNLYRGNTRLSIWGSRAIGGPFRFARYCSTAFGTIGYLLRRGAAEKLLAHGYPVRVVADDLTGGEIGTGVRLYGLDPPCIREWSPRPGFSTVRETHSDKGRWPTRDEVGLVEWFLHRSKMRLIRFRERVDPRFLI